MKKYVFLLTYLVISTTVLAQKAKAHINHTAVYVVDLKPSAKFYREVIGLDTVAEPFHDGKHAWFITGEHTMLHVIAGAKSYKEYYKNQHTCFSVPSIQDFVEKLKKINMHWEDKDGKMDAITTRVDGIHQLWVKDPDGYWVEINDDSL